MGVAGALSGETLLFSQAAQKLIPLQDLKTGDHIPCAGVLTEKLTLDATTRWCEVKNHVRGPCRPDWLRHMHSTRRGLYDSFIHSHAVYHTLILVVGPNQLG